MCDTQAKLDNCKISLTWESWMSLLMCHHSIDHNRNELKGATSFSAVLLPLTNSMEPKVNFTQCGTQGSRTQSGTFGGTQGKGDDKGETQRKNPRWNPREIAQGNSDNKDKRRPAS